MDEGVRAQPHDGVDGGEKMVIDEALPQVPAVLVQAAELRQAQVAVTDVDESHLSPARNRAPRAYRAHAGGAKVKGTPDHQLSILVP